jgi:polo-like kinase 4
MANEPRADIEIRTSPRLTTAAVPARTTAAIRIRFSRKLRTMQIFSKGPRQCKKNMFCTARGVPTDAGDWASLSSHEKECLAVLLDFLRIVEAVEGLPRDPSEPLITATAERPFKQLTKGGAAPSVASTVVPRSEKDISLPKDNPPNSTTPAVSAPSTAAPPSIQVTVSPRPRFPSTLLRATSDTFRKASSTAVSDEPPPGCSPSSLADCAQSIGPLHDTIAPCLQARFMPGVGWCVRSSCTRYRIMFTDGVALEIDVGEERVEMIERDGSVARSYFFPTSLMAKLTNQWRRYTVRGCSMSREVGDRMKAFREFLPLFDESDC